MNNSVSKEDAALIEYLLVSRIDAILYIIKAASTRDLTDLERKSLPKELSVLTDKEIAAQHDHWDGLKSTVSKLIKEFDFGQDEEVGKKERTFCQIGTDDLKAKIEEIAGGEISVRDRDCFSRLIDEIEDDLDVSFDFENYNFEKISKDYVDQEYAAHINSAMGYCSLPNGLCFLGIEAGGDWEQPIYFIIYWDGDRLRAYVPEKGNFWNTKTRTAYGNSESDVLNLAERVPLELNDGENIENMDINQFDLRFVPNLVIEDIVENIKPR